MSSRSNSVTISYYRLFIFQNEPLLFYLDDDNNFKAYFPPVGMEEKFIEFLAKIVNFTLERYPASKLLELGGKVEIPLSLFNLENGSDSFFIDELIKLGLIEDSGTH